MTSADQETPTSEAGLTPLNVEHLPPSATEVNAERDPVAKGTLKAIQRILNDRPLHIPRGENGDYETDPHSALGLAREAELGPPPNFGRHHLYNKQYALRERFEFLIAAKVAGAKTPGELALERRLAEALAQATSLSRQRDEAVEDRDHHKAVIDALARRVHAYQRQLEGAALEVQRLEGRIRTLEAKLPRGPVSTGSHDDQRKTLTILPGGRDFDVDPDASDE